MYEGKKKLEIFVEFNFRPERHKFLMAVTWHPIGMYFLEDYI